MNKIVTRIIVIFLLISIFPFMRMCDDTSYGFPTVAIDGSPLEAENYNFLAIIINTLVAAGLIVLFTHLIKTKKIDLTSKSVRWGIGAVVIFLALHLISLSFGIPKIESKYFMYLVITIQALVTAGLIFLFLHLIKTKKIDPGSKKVRWWIVAVILFFVLNAISIGIPVLTITHFGSIIILQFYPELQINSFYPISEDLPARIGFIIGILVYYFAGYGIRKLIDFKIRKKNKE